MLQFETRLHDLRIDNDLTQAEISKIIKVKRSTYSMWEIGKSDFPIPKANELANYYEITLDYLLGISDVSKVDKKEIDFDIMIVRLKDLRKEKKLTQTKLGEAVGFSQTTYTCYENGTSRPTTFKLLYIAKYYNVSFDYLVGRSDNRVIQKGK